jgi:hypothetical protein
MNGVSELSTVGGNGSLYLNVVKASLGHTSLDHLQTHIQLDGQQLSVPHDGHAHHKLQGHGRRGPYALPGVLGSGG